MSGFRRIAVVGLGLLGGSVAWAARARGVARSVVGATRQERARAEALAKGAVDEILPLEDVARGADLVVLATPVHAMPQILQQLLPGLDDGAIVTDVGSVKGALQATLPSRLPAGVVYVGSHPMAGSHERGMEVATPELFEQATCVVSGDDDAASERVAEFWRALGARVVHRDPDAHDAQVAWTSHAPHLLAFAFAAAFEHAPAGSADLIGPGFRDFTRIAHAEPEMWADIFAHNDKALAAALAPFRDTLDELVRRLEAGDAEAVAELVAHARDVLQRSSVAPRAADSTNPNPSTPENRASTPTRRTKYAS